MSSNLMLAFQRPISPSTERSLSSHTIPSSLQTPRTHHHNPYGATHIIGTPVSASAVADANFQTPAEWIWFPKQPAADLPVVALAPSPVDGLSSSKSDGSFSLNSSITALSRPPSAQPASSSTTSNAAKDFASTPSGHCPLPFDHRLLQRPPPCGPLAPMPPLPHSMPRHDPRLSQRFAVEFKCRSAQFVCLPGLARTVASASDLVGCHVIVEGDRGEDLGRVTEAVVVSPATTTTSHAPAADAQRHFPKILRRATALEVLRLRSQRRDELALFEKIQRLRPEDLFQGGECLAKMRFIGAEWQFDRRKFYLFFEGPEPVEFKFLARYLFTLLHCRVWIHHVDYDYSYAPRKSASQDGKLPGVLPFTPRCV